MLWQLHPHSALAAGGSSTVAVAGVSLSWAATMAAPSQTPCCLKPAPAGGCASATLLANATCGLLSHPCEEAHVDLHLLHAVLQGILIEASPSHFKGMAAARPAATCVHAAICNTSSIVHYADAGDQRTRRTQTA